MGKFKDLTGQRFGMLTVIGRAPNHCGLCDCGNETVVVGCNLVRGHNKSCGCNKLKAISEKLKKYNSYDLSGYYGVGYCSDGTQFYFDKEDYELIKNYCWCNNGKGYLVAGEISRSSGCFSAMNRAKDRILPVKLNIPQGKVSEIFARHLVTSGRVISA